MDPLQLWGMKLKVMGKGQGCVAVWCLTPYFGYFILPPRWLVGVTPCPRICVQKFKFNHMNKWYMHNSASILENETHKLFWEFDIQTVHLISARRPDLIIINKKNCGLCCPGWPQSKIERKKERKKVKRRISTSTLLGNWKNCGT